MTIDLAHFTPATALLGGALIGLAAALLALFNGQQAGISSIVGGVVRSSQRAGEGLGWRLAFIGGLLAAPTLYGLIAPLPEFTVQASAPVLAIAGLLVGFGTRLGSGCTSGHGVCGLARLSLRSLVATLTFIAVGVATVFLTYHG
jgi:uncharacterized protein